MAEQRNTPEELRRQAEAKCDQLRTQLADLRRAFDALSREHADHLAGAGREPWIVAFASRDVIVRLNEVVVASANMPARQITLLLSTTREPFVVDYAKDEVAALESEWAALTSALSQFAEEGRI